jgi:hypothetical protein
MSKIKGKAPPEAVFEAVEEAIKRAKPGERYVYVVLQWHDPPREIKIAIDLKTGGISAKNSKTGEIIDVEEIIR